MARDLVIAIALAAALSLLISVIEVRHQSKVRSVAVSCRSIGFLLYFLVLLVGNVFTTWAAATIVSPYLGESQARGVNDDNSHKPRAEAPKNSEGATVLRSAGLSGFLYAFLGVFAFEAVLKRVNVTFVDQGVLTISDWINKARDDAVAGAIASQVDAQVKREQALALKLVQAGGISDADLNTYVQNWLGPARVQELEQAAEASHANPRLAKAIALATGAYDRAATLVRP
jgi:hypothetical protein